MSKSKPKKSVKKLSMKKQTVRVLDDEAMESAVGGGGKCRCSAQNSGFYTCAEEI